MFFFIKILWMSWKAKTMSIHLFMFPPRMFLTFLLHIILMYVFESCKAKTIMCFQLYQLYQVIFWLKIFFEINFRNPSKH